MIKILLADDHSIVRKGLKQILQEEFPEALFEEAADGLELLRKARLFNADIIISDLSMPGRSGMDTLKQLKAELPSTPVSYTHLRAHETVLDIVCRLLLEKKKIINTKKNNK